MKKTSIHETCGNTPIVKLSCELNCNLFAKIESFNPFGSVKDRGAFFLLGNLLNKKVINQNTIIIESSSGNFGVALASYCQYYNLKFYCVVDPNILPDNLNLIKRFGANVIMSTKKDAEGNYLGGRLEIIKKLLEEHENIYWTNQYHSEEIVNAYSQSLGDEILNQMPDVDYIFLGVSSGGTIGGISKSIKQRNHKAKIIAVDPVGSKIFGFEAKKRFVPGIGSTITPDNIKKSSIYEVERLDEFEGILGCRELVEKHQLFQGGSSGLVYASAKSYIEKHKEEFKNKNVLMLFADGGDRYSGTVYNDEWVKEKFGKEIK